MPKSLSFMPIIKGIESVDISIALAVRDKYQLLVVQTSTFYTNLKKEYVLNSTAFFVYN